MPEEIEARLRRQEAIGVAACSLAPAAAFLSSSKVRVAKLLQAGEIEGNRVGRSVPRGTLPPSEPCSHLSAHTAPRFIIRPDLLANMGFPRPMPPLRSLISTWRFRLHSLSVSILHRRSLAFIVSFDEAPALRWPPFGVGISRGTVLETISTLALQPSRAGDLLPRRKGSCPWPLSLLTRRPVLCGQMTRPSGGSMMRCGRASRPCSR
jgi:hypothetical protein